MRGCRRRSAGASSASADERTADNPNPPWRLMSPLLDTLAPRTVHAATKGARYPLLAARSGRDRLQRSTISAGRRRAPQSRPGESARPLRAGMGVDLRAARGSPLGMTQTDLRKPQAVIQQMAHDVGVEHVAHHSRPASGSRARSPCVRSTRKSAGTALPFIAARKLSHNAVRAARHRCRCSTDSETFKPLCCGQERAPCQP